MMPVFHFKLFQCSSWKNLFCVTNSQDEAGQHNGPQGAAEFENVSFVDLQNGLANFFVKGQQ